MLSHLLLGIVWDQPTGIWEAQKARTVSEAIRSCWMAAGALAIALGAVVIWVVSEILEATEARGAGVVMRL